MTSDKRTFKDYFFNNRRREPKDISRENFQGEFGGMDSFIERENMAALDGRWMSGDTFKHLGGRKPSDAGSQGGSRKASDASAQGGSRKGSKHFDMTEVPEEINTV